MFTLPVKPSALILSKMLVSFLWIVVSIAVTIVSIFLLTLDPSVITAIGTFFQEIADVFLGTHGQQAIIFIIELVVGCIIGIFSSILMVYAAIALGHLFQKHRVLASFGAYLVIMFILASDLHADPEHPHHPMGYRSWNQRYYGGNLGHWMPVPYLHSSGCPLRGRFFPADQIHLCQKN